MGLVPGRHRRAGHAGAPPPAAARRRHPPRPDRRRHDRARWPRRSARQRVLDLLDALTEADSLATGPSAWGAWKAELVEELVDRVGHVLGGGEIERRHLVAVPVRARHPAHGRGAHDRAWPRPTGSPIVAPDRPGLFSRVAGVLALHGLDVLGAQAHSDEQGMAAQRVPRAAVLATASSTGTRVAADLERAIAGQLAIEARLAERARTYRRRRPLAAGPAGPTVRIDNEASSNATVVEVGRPRPHRAAVPDHQGPRRPRPRHPPRAGADAGADVVDSFYVRAGGGQGDRPLPPGRARAGPAPRQRAGTGVRAASDLCRPRPLGRVPAVAADEEAIDVDTTSSTARWSRAPARSTSPAT